MRPEDLDLAASDRIGAIFLDAGNTLIHSYPDEVTVLCDLAESRGYYPGAQELSLTVADGFRRFEARTLEDASFWGDHQDTRGVWMDFYSSTITAHDIPDEVAQEIAFDACEHFSSPVAWKLYDDVMPALRMLSAQGLGLGVISNWDLNLHSILEALGVAEHLDFILSSGRIGRSKPYHQIFEIGVERSGVSSAECMHVGDHYFSDVMGARAAGISAVLLDRKGVHDGLDCPVIHSLVQISDVISCIESGEQCPGESAHTQARRSSRSS